ncbi:hypothetical protein SAMN04488527_101289 [Aliiroseovarius crassostreae]|uniref:XRE family transcriptional regulator n=1 Tax=Aliiroseovarius crassostreae TaxID=154981 RepID=A0A0P7IZL2_9RHOB|nr:hypothetical protein [Aliiroseovarius crassostreae]KPN64286.1 hypothetical protein AKJ29_16770 [Aliiroseovarius crassostreae]SFU31680.1 hypothetical protein SAMN04488527_101289 [Aliiroseovarius crassostreae]
MRKHVRNPSPGEWLHQAIMGALKGRGVKLEDWCKENGITSPTVRTYTYGLNAGPRSKEMLEKLIDDAGRESVLAMYQHRLFEQAEQFKKAS